MHKNYYINLSEFDSKFRQTPFITFSFQATLGLKKRLNLLTSWLKSSIYLYFLQVPKIFLASPLNFTEGFLWLWPAKLEEKNLGLQNY